MRKLRAVGAWLLARLSERSTYTGLLGLLTVALGYAAQPDVAAALSVLSGHTVSPEVVGALGVVLTAVSGGLVAATTK